MNIVLRDRVYLAGPRHEITDINTGIQINKERAAGDGFTIL